MQQLQEVVDRISPLSAPAWAEVEGLLSLRTVTAGEQLLRAGQRASHIFFVRSGLIREFYVDIAGREATRHFSTDGDLSGSLADLLSTGGAAVSIEALIDSVLLEAEWSRLNALSEAHPSLMRLMRRIAEHLYLRKTQREFEMLTLPAAERYRFFVRRYPGLDAKLHRHQVASYLGITAVHLSRISATASQAKGRKPANG